MSQVLSYQPPSLPTRTMAEWEEVSHVILTWSHYQETLLDIIRAVQTEAEVLILCQDSQAVRQQLLLHEVPTGRVSYLETEVNSPWVRDYGPQSVYVGEVDSLFLVDWRYNRHRPDDDGIPAKVAQHLGLACLSMSRPPFDFVHIGGNFLVDGWGTGFSSRLILEDNQAEGRFNITRRSEFEIDALMYRFMGIRRYVKLPKLPYDPINHLDMQVKLLDEETIMVGKYPPGVADGPYLERYVRFLEDSMTTAFGGNYRVVRIPMPAYRGAYPHQAETPYQSYVNALIVNRLIMVPMYGSELDSLALRLYRREMPGYRVVGIDCQEIIRANGALHCITQTVGVRDPLLIVHQPPKQLPFNWNGPTLSAVIAHRSGVDMVLLHFQRDFQSPFEVIEMKRSAQNIWEVTLPIYSSNTAISYYIEAYAHNGKRITRPMTAPHGTWRLQIGPDAMR